MILLPIFTLRIKCNKFGTYFGEVCGRLNDNIKYLSIIELRVTVLKCHSVNMLRNY